MQLLVSNICGILTTVWPESSMRVRVSGSFDLPYDPPPFATADVIILSGAQGEVITGAQGEGIKTPLP